MCFGVRQSLDYSITSIHSTVCSYGWGKNAPNLELPEGVGFAVGKGTSIRYIVAQVCERSAWLCKRGVLWHLVCILYPGPAQRVIECAASNGAAHSKHLAIGRIPSEAGGILPDYLQASLW